MKNINITINLNNCTDAWEPDSDIREKRINMMLENILPFTDGPELIEELLSFSDEDIAQIQQSDGSFTWDDQMLVAYTEDCLYGTAREIRDLCNKLEFYKRKEKNLDYISQIYSEWTDWEDGGLIRKLAEYVNLFRDVLSAYCKIVSKEEGRELLKWINELYMSQKYYGNAYTQLQL